MLELSDIKSSPEELQDYYAQLREQNVTPAWIGGGISIEPQSKAVPHLWRWLPLPVLERLMGKILILKAFKPLSTAISPPLAA